MKSYALYQMVTLPVGLGAIAFVPGLCHHWILSFWSRGQASWTCRIFIKQIQHL